MNRKIRIQRLAPQDREEWQKLYYRHKSHQLRRRLLALRAIWNGQTLIGVCRSQQLDRHTLERWLDLYLHGGFPVFLAPPDTHNAWAPKNTAPTVPSDERSREKLNGFLSVDLLRGSTKVDFRAQSKTNDAVVMIVLLVLR